MRERIRFANPWVLMLDVPVLSVSAEEIPMPIARGFLASHVAMGRKHVAKVLHLWMTVFSCVTPAPSRRMEAAALVDSASFKERAVNRRAPMAMMLLARADVITLGNCLTPSLVHRGHVHYPLSYRMR